MITQHNWSAGSSLNIIPTPDLELVASMLDELLSAVLDNLISFDYENGARKLPVIPRIVVHVATLAIVFGIMFLIFFYLSPFFAGSGAIGFLALLIAFPLLLVIWGAVGRLVLRAVIAVIPSNISE